METIRAAERAEAAYDRRMYRYKAYYSLDCDNGIENAILMKPQTPEMLLEEKQLREQLYAAVMALPEKQAKRIYARYYLGMRVSEIATAEGVDQSRVRDSIRRMNGGKVLLEHPLAELQANIVKVLVALPDEAKLPEGLDILHQSSQGHLYTLIVHGDAAEVTNRLSTAQPQYLDVVPLTLEEIFIYELGGADYAVKDILL